MKLTQINVFLKLEIKNGYGLLSAYVLHETSIAQISEYFIAYSTSLFHQLRSQNYVFIPFSWNSRPS
jgi:hypothetical protein